MGSLFQQDPLFVHPKISRREAPTKAAAATPTTATEAAVGEPTATGCRDNTDSARPRVVPVTGIFQQGESEWHRISNAPREAAQNINDRVAGTPILGLHVEYMVTHVDIRVESGTHRLPIPSRPSAASRAGK